MGKIIEKIKFKIAEHYDKKENYCWANLVVWALGYNSFLSLFLKNHDDHNYTTQICRPDFVDYAYCGKCNKYFNKDRWGSICKEGE
jgi:hypothetical protein